jgi:hypothetical protein
MSSSGVETMKTAEVPMKTVWPTIGRTPVGRLVGVLCGSRVGSGFWTLGRLWAVAMIPLGLVCFAWQFAPYVARRYRVTNRRILILLGLTAEPGPAIGLDEFDAIDIDVLPGHDWLHSGDLVFRREAREVFRLPGVSRPEVFREVCRKAQMAMTSVGKVLEEQKVKAEAATALS